MHMRVVDAKRREKLTELYKAASTQLGAVEPKLVIVKQQKYCQIKSKTHVK